MRNVYFSIAYWLLIICGVFDVCSNLTLAQYLPPPTVATEEATNITASSATLNGTVSPGRSPSVWFEYGKTSGLYEKLTESVSGPRIGTETVSIDISGLSAATTYYYRIAAKDNWPGGSSDTAYGDEKSFTTLETTATPTPSITPTVIPTPECEVKFIEVLPKRLKLKRGENGEVIVTLEGDNCEPEGQTITAIVGKGGSERISIPPISQETDENGVAKFTITAKNKIGNARVTFKAGSLKKSIIVKVRR